MPIIPAVVQDGASKPEAPGELTEAGEVERHLDVPETGRSARLRAIYEVLSHRHDTGETNLAARHDEPQPCMSGWHAHVFVGMFQAANMPTKTWACHPDIHGRGYIEMSAPKPKYKTCRRIDAPGDAHALTFTCFQGRPFLSRDRSRLWMIESIERARAHHGFHLWSYVLMPEHVHLLIVPPPGRPISAILTSLKQSVSRRSIAFVRRDAPGFLPRMTDRQPNGKTSLRFWQRGGGHDRNLWEPGAIWAMIDYIHANPVRRGLCQGADEWPWSSAGTFGDRNLGTITLDLHSLPEDPRV